MIKGNIRLYTHHGIEVERAFYHGKQSRELILERWENSMKHLFERDKLYIQIAPYASIYRVRKDGTNSNSYRKLEPEPEPKFIRPSPVYNNEDIVGKYLGLVIN